MNDATNPACWALIAAMMTLALAGCTSSNVDAGRVFVAPGKYELYDCPQLERQASSLTTREAELAKLMEKAKQSAGGGLVSALSYDTEYVSIHAELREVSKTQAAKQCDVKPPKS